MALVHHEMNLTEQGIGILLSFTENLFKLVEDENGEDGIAIQIGESRTGKVAPQIFCRLLVDRHRYDIAGGDSSLAFKGFTNLSDDALLETDTHSIHA